ncbi:MAG: WD40 repeat domain-containing protein [Lewinellaceae bacterium]|nr:WD40 repeat domain-containing protein [Lewinellaceae bacterium]
MRTYIFFILALLFVGSLPAQNYYQSAPPEQQVQQIADCYSRNLDYGNAAFQRGEAKEALLFFKEAKNCPDAQGNARRQTELDSRITRCEERLGIKKTAATEDKNNQLLSPNKRKRAFSSELPTARRNYSAKTDFLKDTRDSCFQRMVEEADRAYNLRYWEDAAAIYRAAKNCGDADQNDRHRMSEKITICRKAAENELFTKQQEAERQARHAIAANLADDAQEILRSRDRSIAFRLADFANQYIAPDDNPDCVQTMFDAWYYQPSEDSKYREDELYRPVFCYELADNLGEKTQVKFNQQKDGSQWLWAFVPKTGDMFAWVMPSMKMVQSYGTGEGNGYTGFDFAPNGELLFWGKKFFDLRQGTRSYRVDVPSVARWCFSTRSDEFFYENIEEQKIYVLNVREAFAQQYARKGSKNANIIQVPAVPREMVAGVPTGLLAMQYLEGKFWLGFRDRIEILGKSAPGQKWQKEKTMLFNGVVIPEFVEQKDLNLVFYPKEGFAILSCTQGAWSIPLHLKPENQETESKAKSWEKMYPLAVSPSTHHLACQDFSNYKYTTFLLLDASTGDTLIRQRVAPDTEFEVMKGSFSPDARWVAASSYNGNLNVWALQDAPTVWETYLPFKPESKPVFSPDGSLLFATFKDTLAIFNTGNARKPAQFWKNSGQTMLGASDHWVMLQVSPDSAEARHLTDGRSIRFLLKNEGNSFLYAFDAKGEKYMAYLSDMNEVEVRSLKTGTMVASKVFEGGSISDLHFVPGTDQLLVVQHNAMGVSLVGESSVKIWSPLRQSEKPRALRLHDYAVRAVAIEGSGNLAAFSNGGDIRVFDLKNIENEILKIREFPEEYVQAIAFRANSNLLAAAYSTGKVVFWNFQTGQASLQLQAVPSSGLVENVTEISAMGFSHDGTVLQIAVSDGRWLAYALDPSFIRSVAQNGHRQLQAFGVEHIVRYNLEAALYYPGNFERLAESGDPPLIRSFFRHFRAQAIESNNIVQVRDYCDRAFYLFERLDENTKEIWRADMRFMYEDYARKLLLRGNLSEASIIIKMIKREFNYEPDLLNAHMALLKREYATSSALYSKYLLTENGAPMTFLYRWYFDIVEKDMTQLWDYELIDSSQINCFCGAVTLSGAFSNFCPLGKNYSSEFLSTTNRTQWEIFQKRNEASSTLRHAIKTKNLEDAQQMAKNLARQNPAEGISWLETVTMELATAQRKWGDFEQSSPEALLHFEKAVQILTEIGAFKKISDTSRLSLLTSTHLAWGEHLLDVGKTSEALAQFYLGLKTAQPLSEELYESDTSLLRIYFYNLVGPLYKNIGMALLLEGKTGEARQALEQANIYYVTYGLNSIFPATVAVLENDDTQAFLDYGGITDPFQTGEALYWISRLAEQFPEKSTQIEAYAPRLRATLRSVNQRLLHPATDYWYAKLKADHFIAQSKWDSVIHWNTVAMQYAKRCAELPNADDAWTRYWLDEHINVPYFLLLEGLNNPTALEECMRYVQLADDFLAKMDSTNFYYDNRELLKTNLAHALILRNQTGDRERAIELYKHFLQSYADSRGYDNWDILQRDFREFRRAGASWPALPELEEPSDEER